MHELLPAMALAEGGLHTDEQLSERDRFVRDMADRVRVDLVALSAQLVALDTVLQVATRDQAATFVGMVAPPPLDPKIRNVLWERIQAAGD